MKKEDIQEDQYIFPYHYLTSVDNGAAFTYKNLQWGFMHISYIEFLISKIKKLEIKSILDVGCGDGRVLYEIERKLNIEKLTGIDISERALNFAKGFTKNSKFYKHNIIKEPFSDRHDLCISIEVIEHIKPAEIPQYIQNISDSLNEDGLLILTTPTTNVKTHRKHYQHFTLESIQNYLNKNFTIEEVHYLNVENQLSNLLSRLLSNKYFIITSVALRKQAYNFYKKFIFIGEKHTGSRIFIKAKKISS